LFAALPLATRRRDHLIESIACWVATLAVAHSGTPHFCKTLPRPSCPTLR
jgi:hypothetical protein